MPATAKARGQSAEVTLWRTEFRGHLVSHLDLNVSVVKCVCAQLFSCVWLFCGPLDRIPPGSSIHGFFQARILEWVAISYSRGSSPPRDRTRVSALQADSFTV